jgi:Ca2+-binding RTX toxin-like protein
MQSSLIVFTLVVVAGVIAGVVSAPPGRAATTATATTATCRGVEATIVGTSASEVIHGTAGRDVIVGLGGSDTIYAEGGDDLVCGGYGADHLYGGTGSDTLCGGHDLLHVAAEDGRERVGDTLRGGPGDDRLRGGRDRRAADLVVRDVFSWDESAGGVHVDLGSRTAEGEGHDTFVAKTFSVVGSAYGDVVEGSAGPDRIFTGPGPDVVRARAGRDVVDVDGVQRGVGGEADRVRGGKGADRITAGRGDDRLYGDLGDDSLEDMGAGHDGLFGGGGDDSVIGEIGGGDRPQLFRGGRGFDTLNLYSDQINRKEAPSTGAWDMASGAMTFTLDREVSLSATSIERAIFATWGTSWSVTGTPGDDFVSGTGSSRTRFVGRAGADVFRGSEGDDVFRGGRGQDHSLGMGDGDDTCVSVEQIDRRDCEHVR